MYWFAYWILCCLTKGKARYLMPKIKEEPVDPMQTYLEGSDWKRKCSKLLEALRQIDVNTQTALTAKIIARKAIKHFEENK